MFNSRTASKIYDICNWIARLATVNVLWIAFSVLGLILFGVFPAMIALFFIIHIWIKDGKVDSLLYTYWRYFRKYLVWGNALGIILVLISSLIYIDYQLIGSFQGLLYWLMVTLLIFVTILFAILFIYIFPVIVYYRLDSLKNTMLNALLIGISRLPSSISMYILLFICLFVFKSISGLAIFFFPSTIALGLCLIANGPIAKVEMKRKQFNKQ